jgi:uncharacterized membrane protein YgdD (TMEM256/DUF423 family)
MLQVYVRTGAIAALLAVAIGAFGAHVLEDRISSHYMEIYNTGVQYHMFHSAGILLVAALADKLHARKLTAWAFRLLLAGIIIFSGSLYTLAVTGIGFFGAITPIGGVSFVAGWLCLALAAGKSKTKEGR